MRPTPFGRRGVVQGVDEEYLVEEHPQTVHVELRGPVEAVAQVRGWIAGRAAWHGSQHGDDTEHPGWLRVEMTVVPPPEE